MIKNKFNYLATFFLLAIFAFNTSVYAHSVQLGYCVSCNTGELILYLEHWHGNTDPSGSTLTIKININGVETTVTGSPSANIHSLLADLPNCGNPVSTFAFCPVEANTYNDWVIYHFPNLPCGVPIIVTVLSGNNIFTEDGCGLFPASTPAFTVSCNAPPVLLITSPTAVCFPTTVDITTNDVTAGSTGGGTLSYWTDALATSSLLSPNSITTSGTYYIKITTSQGCTDIKPVSVTVNPLPVSIAGNDLTICSGTAGIIGVTAVIGNTYFWNPGIGLSDVNVSNPGITLVNNTGTSTLTTYTVTTTISSTGCLSTDSLVITIPPKPALIITNPTVVCSPNTIDISSSLVTIGSSGGAISYWQDQAATVSLNATYYTAVDTSGTYYIKLNSGSCFDVKPVTVAINNDCVWPGDANKDSIADNYDLLPIGLFYSQTGIPRATISNIWQEYLSTNWGATQTNGTDIKHVDCNGDGTVDNNDTLAINLNFSSIHAIVASNFNGIRSLDPDIYFVTSTDFYFVGDWIDVEVWAGNSTIPVTNLYGIAFNIDYDASLVQPGTESLTYSNCWLGTPGTNAITVAKTDPLAATSYGGITRIDLINANGFGKIANFKFQVKTNLQTPAAFHFSISNYKANDAAGAPIVFAPSADSITVFPLTTAVESEGSIQEFTISPNPFSTQTILTFRKEQKHTCIKIMDVFGKEIKTINFTGKQLIIEKAEMQKGIYFVQLIDGNNNVLNRKIIVQ